MQKVQPNIAAAKSALKRLLVGIGIIGVVAHAPALMDVVDNMIVHGREKADKIPLRPYKSQQFFQKNNEVIDALIEIKRLTSGAENRQDIAMNYLILSEKLTPEEKSAVLGIFQAHNEQIFNELITHIHLGSQLARE